ncbi:histidine phosphatase family protein [Actinoplanes sp. NEAU-A12]|uniref:Histidine phosphatase family protein n=1 Tax=Actinoplanes sandaracinus TaxID=3045177 RepID=A0ABT6X102_9ACTN|nr:histidine phosphatase family protein [Actinoplanes sandaracinus]MDI6105691.1 histidine phosphatase family protein [Actinoplanes sandaracinus]
MRCSTEVGFGAHEFPGHLPRWEHRLAGPDAAEVAVEHVTAAVGKPYALLLVRHAMPALNPEVAPERWELDTAGRRGAESLTHVLPPDAVLVSSQEPKARQTLEPTGPVATDHRFNEVARNEPHDGDFRRRRRAYLAGADHPKWEPREQVVARFHAGIKHWRPPAAARPLVVATHGMAMTLWLAAAVDLADPISFWDDLRLPDVFAVDPAGRTVERVDSGLLYQLR